MIKEENQDHEYEREKNGRHNYTKEIRKEEDRQMMKEGKEEIGSERQEKERERPIKSSRNKIDTQMRKEKGRILYIMKRKKWEIRQQRENTRRNIEKQK